MASRNTDREDCTLTESLMFEIVEIVEKGNFRKVAAQRVGVPPVTLYSWIHRGKRYIKQGNTDRLQAQLAMRIEKAEAKAHQEILADVLDTGDAKVKLTFLRLRYPREYNFNPNAHVDDETGQESRSTLAEQIKEKLRLFSGGNE